jgi:hypothetical protein
MKFHQLLFICLLLLICLKFGFGQTNYKISIEGNSYKHPRIYRGLDVITRYERYSKDDLISFSEKLNQLSQTKLNNWEDSYTSDIGDARDLGFIWHKDKGFVSYYIDTCYPELTSIDFGKVKETVETLEIIPQLDKKSPQKKQGWTKFIKVRWDDRKYLVEESALLSFAEYAAGIYVNPPDTGSVNYNHWTSYWVTGDMSKEPKGLPVFPKSYKRFERKQIFSKIISVGKRTIEDDKTLGNINFSKSVFYEVKIKGGKDLGIKEGMEFYCSKLWNRVYVTKVNSNTSIGYIQIDIDENESEKCTNSNYEPIQCPKIQKGFRLETMIGFRNYEPF